ncbi:MAG TPA: penicillin-binding protein 2 [Patescibacteria group bacterium]
MGNDFFKHFNKNQIKDPDLRSRRDLNWTEDVYLSVDQKAGRLKPGDKNEFLGLSVNFFRLKLFFGLLIVLLAVLLLRAVYLQIIQGDYYQLIAETNRIRLVPIKAPRGVIYDRHQRQLVQNNPNFALYLIPIDFPDEHDQQTKILTEIYQLIQEKMDLSLEEFLISFQEKLEGLNKYSYQPILIHDNLEHNDAVLLKIKSGQLPGIVLDLESKRNYLFNNTISLSHLVGYLGRLNPDDYQSLKDKEYQYNDKIGVTGLEAVYEGFLRGLDGKKQVEVNALGKTIKTVAQEAAVEGASLVLAIDFELQSYAEETLKKYLELNDKSRAAIIIQDPSTGQVMTMVSYPPFDNNLFAGGISSQDYQALIGNSDQPLFNRAALGTYPSGSTFKPVVALAALEEAIISPSTTVLSQGGLRISSWFFPDWQAGGHGLTNVTKALAESVNTFFYMIGGGYGDFEGLGVNRITDYAQKFGFGDLTGIDLNHEKAGFLPSAEWKETVKQEQWYIGDTYHYAIGQGDVLVTPLQINNMMTVFANQGRLYQPSVAYGFIRNGDFKPVEPVILNQSFISPESLQTVRSGLRQAVTYGTARGLNSLPVTAAGKTGTAQWSSLREPHSWFTGFAPYEDPRLVITVLVEEGGEGTDIAVPVAREILNWYFSRVDN